VSYVKSVMLRHWLTQLKKKRVVWTQSTRKKTEQKPGNFYALRRGSPCSATQKLSWVICRHYG
jgi:hypothetical protein